MLTIRTAVLAFAVLGLGRVLTAQPAPASGAITDAMLDAGIASELKTGEEQAAVVKKRYQEAIALLTKQMEARMGMERQVASGKVNGYKNIKKLPEAQRAAQLAQLESVQGPMKAAFIKAQVLERAGKFRQIFAPIEPPIK